MIALNYLKTQMGGFLKMKRTLTLILLLGALAFWQHKPIPHQPRF